MLSIGVRATYGPRHFGGPTRICPTRAEGAETSRGVQGNAPPESFENRVPFNAFSCVLEWVSMHRESDE